MFPSLWLETPYKLEKFNAICIILSVNSELLKFCSNPASCTTSSQSMECRETPCKPVPSAVVRCLKPTKDLDLRLAAFNNNSIKMDFEKIPCKSANARKHMGHIINNSYGYKPMPLKDGLEMNAELYGFTFGKKQD